VELYELVEPGIDMRANELPEGLGVHALFEHG
jgi:hypothetical protein